MGVTATGSRIGSLVRGAVALMAAVTLLLASNGGAGSTGPFDLTGVSQIEFVVPAVGPIPEIHSSCLARAEQGPGPIGFDSLTLRASCYTITKTGPGTPAAPPPPPPPYLPADHRLLLGVVNQTTGEVSLAFDLCIQLEVEGVPTGLTVLLGGAAAKTGGWSEEPDSGTVTLNLDQDADPSDCDTEDSTEISNTFTPANLPLNHNADIDLTGTVAPDSCTTWEELGTDPLKGGLRDPWNAYDMYDVASSGGGPPDGEVDLFSDVLGVIQHYSLDGSPPYDVRFDRGASVGPSAWNMTEPDGVIDLFTDILGVIGQYFHNCTDEPN